MRASVYDYDHALAPNADLHCRPSPIQTVFSLTWQLEAYLIRDDEEVAEKARVWEELNKEYLDKQAARQATLEQVARSLRRARSPPARPPHVPGRGLS